MKKITKSWAEYQKREIESIVNILIDGSNDGSNIKDKDKYVEVSIRMNFANNSPHNLITVCSYRGKDQDLDKYMKPSDWQYLHNKYQTRIITTDLGFLGNHLNQTEHYKCGQVFCPQCKASSVDDYKDSHYKNETFQPRIFSLFGMEFGQFLFVICILHMFERIGEGIFIIFLATRENLQTFDDIFVQLKKYLPKLSYDKTAKKDKAKVGMFTLSTIEKVCNNLLQIKSDLSLSDTEYMLVYSYAKLFKLIFLNYDSKNSNPFYFNDIKALIQSLCDLCSYSGETFC